jgi:hypothetical protein
MDNELIITKTWWSKNWKWFLPTVTFFILFLFGALMSANVDGNITDIAQAYTDDSLYIKAIERANTNERVLEVLGEIEPIDKLALFEGNAVYSNNNNSVVLSIRIKGSKGKGKMDISAEKNGTVWGYKMIKIRIKNPKEEIQVIKDTIKLK